MPKKKSKSTFWVYVVICRNGTLYTGTARNVKERVAQHNKGKGAKYTRAFGPVKLIWSKRYKSRSLACKVESKIKGLNRKGKLEIMAKQPRRPGQARPNRARSGIQRL